MAQNELQDELAQLRKDLDGVRGDLAKLAKTSGSAAESGVQAARERLEAETEELLERLRGAASSAGEKGRSVMEGVEREVGEKPITSLLTAFGVGAVVGWIASRK
jgi:ElaB/YqjD/DUF883 family membrane-anchored ribosome-binding protein